MSAVESPQKKSCPKCKQVDVTTFATCRNCGTRYDFAPEVKHKEVALGMPLFMSLILVAAAACVYQYFQMQHTYVHPDKLIGKIMRCQQSAVLVAGSAEFLRKFDAESAEAAKSDPKSYGSKGVGGILSAASAINSMAAAMDKGGDTSFSLVYKYIQSGQLVLITSESESPVSVVVLGAKSDAKTSMVQVRVANGPKAGGVFWMNSSDLDLVTK